MLLILGRDTHGCTGINNIVAFYIAHGVLFLAVQTVKITRFWQQRPVKQWCGGPMGKPYTHVGKDPKGT